MLQAIWSERIVQQSRAFLTQHRGKKYKPSQQARREVQRVLLSNSPTLHSALGLNGALSNMACVQQAYKVYIKRSKRRLENQFLKLWAAGAKCKTWESAPSYSNTQV